MYFQFDFDTLPVEASNKLHLLMIFSYSAIIIGVLLYAVFLSTVNKFNKGSTHNLISGLIAIALTFLCIITISIVLSRVFKHIIFGVYFTLFATFSISIAVSLTPLQIYRKIKRI